MSDPELLIADVIFEKSMIKAFTVIRTFDADECFVTGTFAGISPVISIDGRTIENKSNNEISASLSILYKKLISDYVRK